HVDNPIVCNTRLGIKLVLNLTVLLEGQVRNLNVQLAWLIDIQRQQVWVWEQQELPMIYSGTNALLTLGNVTDLTVEVLIAMTQRR
ncbi:MAG: hypothetical protein AAFR31_11790, partial [Cyanobacteria bacterium J06627_8]